MAVADSFKGFLIDLIRLALFLLVGSGLEQFFRQEVNGNNSLPCQTGETRTHDAEIGIKRLILIRGVDRDMLETRGHPGQDGESDGTVRTGRVHFRRA